MQTQDMFLMFKIIYNFGAKVTLNHLVINFLNLLWYKKIYIPPNINQIVTLQMIANLMVASKFAGEQPV